MRVVNEWGPTSLKQREMVLVEAGVGPKTEMLYMCGPKSLNKLDWNSGGKQGAKSFISFAVPL